MRLFLRLEPRRALLPEGHGQGAGDPEGCTWPGGEGGGGGALGQGHGLTGDPSIPLGVARFQAWATLLGVVTTDPFDEARQPCFDIMYQFMCRGELDATSSLEAPPADLLRYRQVLVETTAFVLSQISSKAATANILAFCSRVLSVAFFRLPEMRAQILDAVLPAQENLRKHVHEWSLEWSLQSRTTKGLHQRPKRTDPGAADPSRGLRLPFGERRAASFGGGGLRAQLAQAAGRRGSEATLPKTGQSVEAPDPSSAAKLWVHRPMRRSLSVETRVLGAEASPGPPQSVASVAPLNLGLVSPGDGRGDSSGRAPRRGRAPAISVEPHALPLNGHDDDDADGEAMGEGGDTVGPTIHRVESPARYRSSQEGVSDDDSTHTPDLDSEDSAAVGLGFGRNDPSWPNVWRRLDEEEDSAARHARDTHERHILQRAGEGWLDRLRNRGHVFFTFFMHWTPHVCKFAPDSLLKGHFMWHTVDGYPQLIKVGPSCGEPFAWPLLAHQPLPCVAGAAPRGQAPAGGKVAREHGALYHDADRAQPPFAPGVHVRGAPPRERRQAPDGTRRAQADEHVARGHAQGGGGPPDQLCPEYRHGCALPLRAVQPLQGEFLGLHLPPQPH